MHMLPQTLLLVSLSFFFTYLLIVSNFQEHPNFMKLVLNYGPHNSNIHTHTTAHKGQLLEPSHAFLRQKKKCMHPLVYKQHNAIVSKKKIVQSKKALGIPSKGNVQVCIQIFSIYK